jgi:hypothetical protein
MASIGEEFGAIDWLQEGYILDNVKSSPSRKNRSKIGILPNRDFAHHWTSNIRFPQANSKNV